MKKIELDLMDWKDVEETAEAGIRTGLMVIEMHKLARAEAKINIIKLHGQTSEEEAEDSKKEIKENADRTKSRTSP